MRTFQYIEIFEPVKRLCIECGYELPADVLTAMQNAEKAETNPRAKRILGQLIENARVANNERIPLCQDTGLAVMFV
ncbi:MAG: fumarate hydratase [Planctomycetes bacterium]|nr:fumarate hydratase [Planctomycetota bacterium]